MARDPIFFRTGAPGAAPGVEWLIVQDLMALAAADWIGLGSVTIDGFTMPLTQTGTYTELGPDGATGVVVNPSSAASTFDFNPDIAAMATHFGFTSSVDDQWLIMLTWTAATLTAANSVVRIRLDNAGDTRGWLLDFINSGGEKFRANNYTDFDQIVLAGAQTLALWSFPRAFFADCRYLTSESLDWSTLTPSGFAINSNTSGGGATAPATGNSVVADTVTPTDFRIGTDLQAAADGVTLTNLAIGRVPAPGLAA